MHESGLFGWIPKRPKGPDCKSGGTAFAGSNPAPPMTIPIGMERVRIRRRWEWASRQTVIELTGRIITRRVGDSQEKHSILGRSACWALWPTTAIRAARVGWTPLETCGCNSMVEYLPSKQATWVRFPSPALLQRSQRGRNEENRALHHEQVNRGIDFASRDAANANGLRRVLLLRNVVGRGCRGSVGRARPW